MNFEQAIGFDTSNWPLVVMAFLRVGTMIAFLPIFGNETTPARVKILLAFVMTFAVWPLIERDVILGNMQLNISQGGNAVSPLAISPVHFAIISLREVFFGFAIGFSTKILLFGANIAANAIGVNMGFQTAGTLSPIFAQPDSVLSNFKNWIITILLLILNMHHYFIELIFKSFARIPIAQPAQADILLQNIINIAQTSFEIGLRIAAPLLAIQVITTVALGLLGRLVPQLNVFIVNFPVSYLLSMVILFFSMGTIISYISKQALRDQMMATNGTFYAFEKK